MVFTLLSCRFLCFLCISADLLIQESPDREGRKVPITVYLGSNPDPSRARIDVSISKLYGPNPKNTCFHGLQPNKTSWYVEILLKANFYVLYFLKS